MNGYDRNSSSEKLMARLRNARGGVTDIAIQDLSAAGCMVDCRGTGLNVDDRVLVKLEGLEYMPCHVFWIEDNRAGIGFERVMHETVYEHLRSRLNPAKAA